MTTLKTLLRGISSEMSKPLAIKGQKRLQKRIKKIEDAEKVFDPVFKKVALRSIREYAKETPRDTGDTGRKWKVAKVQDSFYTVSNDKTVGASKIPLVQILNDGRAGIRPRKAKKLYIPLTEAGKARDAGAQFGIDFVLADKAKAYKGTKFIDKVNKRMARLMGSELTKKIRMMHK